MRTLVNLWRVRFGVIFFYAEFGGVGFDILKHVGIFVSLKPASVPLKEGELGGGGRMGR